MEEIERPEKDILSGDVPLTPIQKWFFAKDWANLHHFNQSVLLEVKDKLALHMVKAIFNVVVQYHDVFRFRYRFENGQYFQEYTDNLVVDVEEKEISLGELSKDATRVQGSLNIFEGPIFKVVLYRCLGCPRDRLLIVAHHLMVDGVSWRILIDDIETIYRGFKDSCKVALPSKTYSYRQWANALMGYINTEEGKQEVKYWQDVERSIVETVFPSDFEENNDDMRCDCIKISLSKQETKKLIQEVPKKYDAQMNDILLTALTLASGEVSGKFEFCFALEGHGREDVIGLDVSRTIGWFTSIFPVFLKVTDPRNLRNCIEEVKFSLHQIPNKGVGYGIVRCYTDFLRKALPRVSFNYLGQWEVGNSESIVFSYAKEFSGEEVDKKNTSNNLIDINGLVKNLVFEMGFAYQQDFYKKETIEKFANSFKKRLLEMIAD